MTLRIGVIGAGIMGSDHATILHRWISGASTGMIVDIDADRARQLSEQVASSWSTDVAELIKDSDAVIIASHDSTHPELVRACLDAGKPVMCEKPLAPTLAEAIEVYRAEEQLLARQGGHRLVSVGFMRRFDPAYVELKTALHSGSYGSALVLHCISRTVTSAPGSTSRSSVTNSAIHEFDVVPWLLDSPVIEAAWHAPRSSRLVDRLQDPQIILLRTANGILATVETFLNARYGYDIRCEVVAETGTIALRDSAVITTFSEGRTSTRLAADWRPRFADAYRLELQAWVDALNHGLVSPLPGTADAVRASAVADAVITSMDSGGSFVPVPDPFRVFKS